MVVSPSLDRQPPPGTFVSLNSHASDPIRTPLKFVAVGRTDADLALSFDVASNPEGPRNIDVSPSVVVEIAQVITRVPGAIASLLVWVRVIYLGTECVAEIVPVVSVKRSA